MMYMYYFHQSHLQREVTLPVVDPGRHLGALTLAHSTLLPSQKLLRLASVDSRREETSPGNIMIKAPL